MVESKSAAITNQNGVVIIAVLWICALIMWFAMQISFDARLQGAEKAHVFRRSQALYLAVGGAYEALARMGASLNLEDEEQDGAWKPNGLPNIVRYNAGQAIVVIEDETEKANVNEASPDALKEVLEAAGAKEEQLDKLVNVFGDFMDSDDLTRLDGAEKDDYEAMGLGYRPFNGPLATLEQMLLVPGITQKLFFAYGEAAKPFEKDEYEALRDLPWPGEDSLFQNCTVYGSNTQVSTGDESGLEELEETPEEGNDSTLDELGEDDEDVSWQPEGTYRILSCGKASTNESSVLLWMIVKYTPSKKPGYEVLHRKIL